MATQCCLRCHFLAYQNPEQKAKGLFGLCRRFPPTQSTMRLEHKSSFGGGMKVDMPTSSHPQVRTNGWCGEWKTRQKKSTTQEGSDA